MGGRAGKQGESSNNDIYIETPLIYSKFLSDVATRPVYLKLENTQPSGSFKLRGISAECLKKQDEGCTKFVGSSGGNAGLALAYTSMMLNIPCQLFVPTYVSPRMLDKIRAYGAEITILGIDWQEADEQARKLVEADSTIGYIHPFDHPSVWEGNSTIVDEIQEQLGGEKPACIVTSVGGGGLLIGILEGLERAGWKDIPVISVEALGADCFNKSIQVGEIVSITLTSVCKTLGARRVATRLWEMHKDFNIISLVISDEEAVQATLKFSDDHATLVEPSCGAALSAVYSKHIQGLLQSNQYKSSDDAPCCVVVCGGSDISPAILEELAAQFDLLTAK